MNKNAKPVLEKLAPNFGNSFTYKQFNTNNQNNSDKFWHYHPELELVYVNEGSGKLLVGSHASFYRNGNLIFIGSNLPHCGFTDTLEKNQQETVVQMLPSFLGKSFFEIPELKNIKNVFREHSMVLYFMEKQKGKLVTK